MHYFESDLFNKSVGPIYNFGLNVSFMNLSYLGFDSMI